MTLPRDLDWENLEWRTGDAKADAVMEPLIRELHAQLTSTGLKSMWSDWVRTVFEEETGEPPDDELGERLMWLMHREVASRTLAFMRRAALAMKDL